MQKIKRKKLYEEVMSRILNIVKINEMKTGDKLHSEKELSDLFGVSRMVIREALSVLQTNGFIEVRHGSGIYIKNIDLLPYNDNIEAYANRQQILNIMELRKGIESEAAYFAALRKNEKDMEYLQHLLSNMSQIILAGGDACAEDCQFHSKIMTICANPFYVKVFNENIQPNYYAFLKTSHKLLFKTIDYTSMLIKEHQEIFDCINAGQADEARRCMWIHIDNIESKMRTLFKVQ